MASAKATIDHDEIRRWVESRGGHPAHVKRTGVLRIDYPGYTGQGTLERISWDDFFAWFDRDNLAFLYQDEGDSRFSKFVDRSTVDVSGGGGGGRKRAAAKRGGTRPRSVVAARSRKASSSKKRTASKKTASKKTASKKTASKKTTSKKRRSSARTATASTRTSRSAISTTNHDEIRKWVEARGGHPAHVKRTGSRKDPGVLRIDYPGYSGKQTLERISWDDWFNWFDRDKLAFLYQKNANSRFSKLVRR